MPLYYGGRWHIRFAAHKTQDVYLSYLVAASFLPVGNGPLTDGPFHFCGGLLHEMMHHLLSCNDVPSATASYITLYCCYLCAPLVGGVDLQCPSDKLPTCK